jgi:hypothetical protein
LANVGKKLLNTATGVLGNALAGKRNLEELEKELPKQK